MVSQDSHGAYLKETKSHTIPLTARLRPRGSLAKLKGRMRTRTALCLLFASSAFAASPSTLPQFSLSDTSGRSHSREEWTTKLAIVLLFMGTDCPLSNSYVPELNRMFALYTPRGVAFYAVQGDATVPVEQVRSHVREFGYAFPYLFDPTESLASYTGAGTTPEAAVLSPQGKLLYLGRIDNRLEEYGKQRVKITEFDLRDALDAILLGQPVPHPRTKVLGCAITRTN